MTFLVFQTVGVSSINDANLSFNVSLVSSRSAIASLPPKDSQPGQQVPAMESVTITTTTTIPNVPTEKIPGLDERMIDALLEEGAGSTQEAQIDEDVIITRVSQPLSGPTMHELELEHKLRTDILLATDQA